ncbi:MAG: hypothetical protein ACXQTG_06400 [Methanoculleaceae archaeon]
MTPAEEAQMSLDLLVGVSIFLLAFLIAATMAPGLYAGLNDPVVDYSAVAYRTGVILAEDTGEPPSWQNLGQDYLYRIERFGLAVDRQSPGILGMEKIERFFDPSLFSYPEDYRSRLIFGSTPYRFNISLLDLDEDRLWTAGGPRPRRYGYIRKVVSISRPGSFEIGAEPEFNATVSPDVTESFTVAFNGTELLDPAIPAAYRIDPLNRPVWINITSISGYLNNSDTNPSPLAEGGSWTEATLSSVRFLIDGSPVPFPYAEIENGSYLFLVDGTPANLSPQVPVNESLRLLIRPGTLPVENYKVSEVVFSFDDDPPAIFIHGNGCVGYSSDHTVIPPLTRAVLEVAVW